MSDGDVVDVSCAVQVPPCDGDVPKTEYDSDGDEVPHHIPFVEQTRKYTKQSCLTEAMKYGSKNAAMWKVFVSTLPISEMPVC
jgi:hypothetical protein